MPDVEDSAWTAARSLLEQPGARGRAIADTGLFTAAPPELAQHVQHPLWGRSALDEIETADRTAVIEAWERTRETGVASVVVRLTEAGRPWVRLTLFDLRDTFGVYLGVTVPEGDQRGAATAAVEPVDVRPRFARVTKNSLAVFTDVDDATCQLLGWSREELVGRRSLEFVHRDDQDLAVAGWLELLGSPGMGRRLRLRHVRKDGGYAWFEVTNYNRLDDPAHGCVSAEILDITDEMAAHEAVRAREQLLHRLAETLPVGVAQLSAEGDVAYANSQLAGLLGIVPEAVADILHAVADADRSRARSALGSVLGGCDSAEVEVEVPRGGPRYCTLAVRRLDDGAGRTTGAVVCLTDITDSTRLRQELRRRATVDPLTGALNRAGTTEALEQAWHGSRAGIAVLFIDLDGFKPVNDELGHEVGDRLLVAVAQALGGTCRASDRVGRLGGDEFLVVCADIAEHESASVLARVQSVLASVVLDTEDGPVRVSASVGMAWTRPGGTRPTELVARADAAMYAEKSRRSAVGRAARTVEVPAQG